MVMPERSFGRTVRYRRTKLGLSQTKLAELVGRSTATVRSWERDRTRPNDDKVLTTLAAILGIDERQLFEKADMVPPQPVEEETHPTVEQVLATLTPTRPAEPLPLNLDDGLEEVDQAPPPAEVPDRDRALTPVPSGPAFIAPPDPFVETPPTPSLADLSYLEDDSQRSMYRVRNLATVVAVVGLFVAFIWAVGEGIGAFGDWWEGFVGQLRL